MNEVDRFGWSRRDGGVGLTRAAKALREAARRQPTDNDRPPPSTFPMTPAARAALLNSRRPNWSRPPSP